MRTPPLVTALVYLYNSRFSRSPTPRASPDSLFFFHYDFFLRSRLFQASLHSESSSLFKNDEEVKQLVERDIPLWNVISNGGDGGSCISRGFTARNFQAALDSINCMGAIAERESHHPNFHLTSYRDVQVDIWTHKMGGITENDLKLAKMIDDEVKIDYSRKWLKTNPRAEATAKNDK